MGHQVVFYSVLWVDNNQTLRTFIRDGNNSISSQGDDNFIFLTSCKKMWELRECFDNLTSVKQVVHYDLNYLLV